MNPDPSSMILNPQTYDANNRISVLRKMLEEDTVAPGQRMNIATVIGMYTNGELPKATGEMVWLQDGKVCSQSDIDARNAWWVEGGGIELMDKPREYTQ